jgi:hypothetical protein
MNAGTMASVLNQRQQITHSAAANIRQLSSHKYACTIHPEFCYNKAAHGGNLVAILWRVVAEHYRTTLARQRQPDIVGLHVEFLRAVGVGDAEVLVQDVRVGKGSSTLGVKMVQGGREGVVGFFTYVFR